MTTPHTFKKYPTASWESLNNKKTRTTLAKLLLALLSLGSAHYIGFLIEIPFEMLSLISLEFAASFIALFAFYLTLSYTVSKVFSFALSQFYYSISALVASGVLAFRNARPKKPSSKLVKLHKDTPLLEKVSYWLAISICFPFLFNFSYLRLNIEQTSQLIAVTFFSILVASILKTEILIRPKRQIRRILDKKRSALRRRLFRDYIYLAAGSAVALSFYTGYLRYEKIMHEERPYIEHKKYNGWAKILMKSGSSYLLVDDLKKPDTLIYIDNNTSIKVIDLTSEK